MPYNFQKKDRKEFYKYRLHKSSPMTKKFFVAERQATREHLKVPELTHEKGKFVNYKNTLVRIEKVTDKGVWVQGYTSEKGFFEKTTKKPRFIKEREWEDHAVPFYAGETAGFLFSPFI